MVYVFNFDFMLLSVKEVNHFGLTVSMVARLNPVSARRRKCNNTEVCFISV